MAVHSLQVIHSPQAKVSVFRCYKQSHFLYKFYIFQSSLVFAVHLQFFSKLFLMLMKQLTYPFKFFVVFSKLCATKIIKCLSKHVIQPTNENLPVIDRENTDIWKLAFFQKQTPSVNVCWKEQEMLLQKDVILIFLLCHSSLSS